MLLSFLLSTLLVLGTVSGQIFDVFASTEIDNSLFGLDMDEVYMTDMNESPVSTKYMRPGDLDLKKDSNLVSGF
jgi:hypothetical protein